MVSIIVDIVIQIIRVIGMWFLFAKCNINSYWSLVPVANNFKVAQCADEEDSGVSIFM